MEAAESAVPACTFRAMGSDALIVIDGCETLIDAARDRLSDLESLWSRFIADSEISALNSSSDWVDVSSDTMTLVDRSLDAWTITGGRFDATVLSTLVALGYDQSKSEIPGHTRLSHQPRRGPSPGPSGVEVDHVMSRVRLGRDAAFDPGGLGKGLAADIVATEAVASGAAAAMVDIGGDIRIAGIAPPEWVVAVENPLNRADTIVELRLEDGSVCTSSVRAKVWMHDGIPVHHLVDPRSGNPIKSSIVGATVIAGDAWIAEALCTSVISGTPVAAIASLESAGVEGLVVDVDGIIWSTSGIGRFTT